MFKLNCSALRTASSTMSTTYPVDLSGHRLLSSARLTILTTRKEVLWLWDFLLNWSSRPFAPSEQWGCLHPQTASSPSHSSHRSVPLYLTGQLHTPHIFFKSCYIHVSTWQTPKQDCELSLSRQQLLASKPANHLRLATSSCFPHWFWSSDANWK